MSQKVTIAVGFAAGLEGEARPLAGGWKVTVTYPQGFESDLEDLGGLTDTLFYGTEELEFFDSAE